MKLYYKILSMIFAVALVACTPEATPDPVDPAPDGGTENVPDTNPEPEEEFASEEAKGEFIILAWSDILDAYDSKWKLEKMVEAQFDTYLGWFDTAEEVEALLTAADETGMKIITSHPGLQSDTENAIKAMATHQSLYGYHIMDEPQVSDFPSLAERVNAIREFDKERPCYINLFPNYAGGWEGENNLKNIRLFLETVPMSLLSFDNYPVLADGSERIIRPDWYANLEDIRTAALEAGLPIWAFALALSHGSYPIPTIGELRLQHYSNMLYGTVAFQYFTTWGFIQDQVVLNVYKIVQQMNSELRAWQRFFYGADIKGIWHTGSVIPVGAQALTTLPTGVKKLETEESGALVTYFTNHGKNYLAVQNKKCNWGMDLVVEFDDPKAKMLSMDGTLSPIEEKYRIPAGDIRVFRW